MPHCNPVQGQYRARTGISLCSKFSQGKTCPNCKDPVFITGIFLRELLYREIPEVITALLGGMPVKFTGNYFVTFSQSIKH